MNLYSVVALLCFILIFSGANANTLPKDSVSQINQPSRVYTTTRLTTPKPLIDGKLNDECWKTGDWGGDFVQWIPKEGAKPSQETQDRKSTRLNSSH